MTQLEENVNIAVTPRYLATNKKQYNSAQILFIRENNNRNNIK